MAGILLYLRWTYQNVLNIWLVCNWYDNLSTLNKFIKNNDKNPFASRKINPKYYFIMDNYIEFLEINNYFTTVKTTADLKIPKGIEYINDFSEKELDELFAEINSCIEAKKVEKILTSKYFELIK